MSRISASPSRLRVRVARRSGFFLAMRLGAAAFLDIQRSFVQHRPLRARLAVTVSQKCSTLRRMSDDRLGGIALIAGSVAMLVTMAFHPWGHQFTEENYFAMALLNGLVHTLGIASIAISFLGAMALWRRLDAPGRPALAALRSEERR